MGRWKSILVMASLVLMLSACDSMTGMTSLDQAGPSNTAPSLEQALTILSSDQDFIDYTNDFKEHRGKVFEPVLVEMAQLTPEFKTERIEKLKSSPVTSAYSIVYEDLPDKPSIYVVQLQDTSLKERGIITVIDFDTREVLKFYATINLIV